MDKEIEDEMLNGPIFPDDHKRKRQRPWVSGASFLTISQFNRISHLRLCLRSISDLHRRSIFQLPLRSTSNFRRILHPPAMPSTNVRLASDLNPSAVPAINFQHPSDIASPVPPSNQLPTCIGCCFSSFPFEPTSNSHRISRLRLCLPIGLRLSSSANLRTLPAINLRLPSDLILWRCRRPTSDLRRRLIYRRCQRSTSDFPSNIASSGSTFRLTSDSHRLSILRRFR